ncbi:FlgO family outer membrane protein [Thalassomonas actiniarum]|uniref:FlgO domain-containing protein n=1 Tax=Thalassomonas actiniarum TaxID=485447 RepID=A0AAF0C3V8_9GAMM|nr:FlgO family outer membrane protein [Thalassomonas actiniarum]WDD99278.1 hypothetical protein SG35_000885 [Thalassomonas actiniarum]
MMNFINNTQKTLQTLMLSVFAVAALTSCTLLKEIQQEATGENKEPELTDDSVPFVLNDQEVIPFFHTHKMVSDYTDKLAHDLFNNMARTELKSPVAVASFVSLDSSLEEGSRLGNLISESLLGQVQEYGIPVMDIHLMNGIEMNSDGEFSFSRKMTKVMNSKTLNYVLSGVVIGNERGYTVNARIIEFGSMQVLSTATTFIPSFVAEVL